MNSLRYILAITLALSASSAFASGDYLYVQGYSVGRCRLASPTKTKNTNPLSHTQNCSVNVNYYFTGYASNADLTAPMANNSSFKEITFWIEYQNPKSQKWARVSSLRKILRNGATIQVNFKANSSGNYRVAFDSYGQDFADDFADPFRLLIK